MRSLMQVAQPGLLAYTRLQAGSDFQILYFGGRMLSQGACGVQHTEAGTRALQMLGRLVRALGVKRQVNSHASLLSSYSGVLLSPVASSGAQLIRSPAAMPLASLPGSCSHLLSRRPSGRWRTRARWPWLHPPGCSLRRSWRMLLRLPHVRRPEQP